MLTPDVRGENHPGHAKSMASLHEGSGKQWFTNVKMSELQVKLLSKELSQLGFGWADAAAQTLGNDRN